MATVLGPLAAVMLSPVSSCDDSANNAVVVAELATEPILLELECAKGLTFHDKRCLKTEIVSKTFFRTTGDKT
jgi:hypothetical protein